MDAGNDKEENVVVNIKIERGKKYTEKEMKRLFDCRSDIYSFEEEEEKFDPKSKKYNPKLYKDDKPDSSFYKEFYSSNQK